MQLPKELTTVTPLSKAVALIMFFTLPIITFLFGMNYQSMLAEQNKPLPSVISPTSEPNGCTEEAKICPDGSAVGRIFPSCEFEECPSVDNSTIQSFCGGIAGKTCPSGYYCKYDGTYPDAGGACVKDKTPTKFICPKSEYVNCMPGTDKRKITECSSEFLKWAHTNCPNFKGAAL